MKFVVPSVLAVLGAVPAFGDVLYSNGPVVTNPTGGTGAIAGLPISSSDGYTIPGQTFIFSTTGVAATFADATAAADDFVVPVGVTWALDSVTLCAYQSSQTTPTITAVHINLWTAAPFSADSPPPVPNPLPQPVLAADLVLPAGPGTFVAHRESPSGTSSVRPVFAYTVSLAGLPNGGKLGPGTYWLQWSFEGASSPSHTVYMPLVSPRTAVTGWNARLLNTLDGSSTGERVWFEGREGYVAGVQDGRAYALPFELNGTAIAEPPPCYANCDGSTTAPVLNVGDFTCFLQKYAAGDPYANCDGSTVPPVLNVGDFTCFLQQYAAGCP
jgi:hypothetical protein